MKAEQNFPILQKKLICHKSKTKASSSTTVYFTPCTMVRQAQKSKKINFRILARDRTQILGTCIDRKNPKFYGIRSSGSGDTTVFVPLVFQLKLKILQFLRFLLIKISTWAHVWACAQSCARGQPKFSSYFNFIWGYLKNATMHLTCPLARARL